MDELIFQLAKSGVLGLILGIVMWDNFKLKKKLFEVVEKNTAAFISLKNSIEERRRRYDN